MQTTTTPATGVPPRSWLAPFLIALAPWALLAWRFDFLCDDAYISFRYARHLAAGHGLVFNLGESPPVEGYSNFLWVLAMAVVERLGGDPGSWSRVLSAAAGAALLAAVTRHVARRVVPGGLGTVASALFLATLPPMAMYATSGLETMPAALFLFLCYERLFGDPDRPRGLAAGIAGLAAALVRADAALWVALVLCAALLASLLRERRAPLARAALLAGIVLAAGVGLHVAWRLSYYGDWLPNTARVKAGFSGARLERGLQYVAHYLLVLPAIALLAPLAAIAWSAARSARAGLGDVALAASLLAGGTFAYALWVGGDFMPFGRFLMPAVPFVAVGFALFWRSAGALRGGRVLRAGFAVLALVCALLAAFDRGPAPAALQVKLHFRRDRPWQSEVERWREMKANLQRWTVLGRALALHTRMGESMISGAIGAQGYHSELFFHDTYGLVSREVVEHARMRENASPGHDMRVNNSFFFLGGPAGTKPTYLGAVVWCRPEHLAQGELPDWAGPRPGPEFFEHDWGKLVDALDLELPESAGFPPGAMLLLLRFHWADNQRRTGDDE